MLVLRQQGRKASSAFQLFDINGDGVISFDEFQTYLFSIFRVIYELEPTTAAKTGVSAETLSEITAAQVFQRYDLNADHNLSWEEFQQWYGDNHDGPSSSSPLESAKISTGLGNFTAEDVFERLAMSANDEGYLTRDAFFEFFEDFGATKKGIQMLSRVRRACRGHRERPC